jgi:choline kinase
MAAAYQAVILAAGRGSRLRELTRELPKALLPIGPRSLADGTPTSFLRRQVELLREHDVREIVVVVGCARQRILDEARRWDVPLCFVVNPTEDMATSGSLHSFQFAARSQYAVLDGMKQTLLMDADIVYHPGALARLLDAPEHTSMLVTSAFDGDDEEVLVWGTAERPRFVGKGLTPDLVAHEACLGEALGIVKFAPADHSLVRDSMDWMLGDPSAEPNSGRHRGFGPAPRATEHEELSQRLMSLRRLRCVMIGPDLPFMECDDPRDYHKLRATFYPRLLELEADHEPTRRRPTC